MNLSGSNLVVQVLSTIGRGFHDGEAEKAAVLKCMNGVMRQHIRPSKSAGLKLLSMLKQPDSNVAKEFKAFLET